MVALVQLWIVLQQPAVSMPEALQNFQRARERLRTGRVTCVVAGGPGILTMPVVQYTTQYAKNGDVLYSYDEDAEGVFDRDMYGYPMMVGRAQVLVQREMAWAKSTFDFSGTMAPRAAWQASLLPGHFLGEKVDLRAIGMAPDWDRLIGLDPSSVLANVTKGRSGYSVERNGGIHRITVTYPDDRDLTYEIDEAKDWNATRISGATRGRAWETVIELRQDLSTWFPSAVTYSAGGEVRTQFSVERAEFNSPVDPAGWMPSDIGLEVGMQVSIEGQEPGPQPLYWDGEGPVPRDEFMKRMDSGELEPGPTLKAIRARKWEQPGKAELARLRTSPGVQVAFISQWEYFVRLFCERNRLNQDQYAQAYKCLHRSQESANQFVSRSREKIEALQKKREAGELTGKQAEEEFTKLRQPVDEIFEKQLKPCLEQIPTRKQREEAEKSKDDPLRAIEEPQHRKGP